MEVKTTDRFNKWVKKLKDKQGAALVVSRLKRVEKGDLGEYKSVGPKVFELKINSGPGYRVYIYRADKTVIVLNAGLIRNPSIRYQTNKNNIKGNSIMVKNKIKLTDFGKLQDELFTDREFVKEFISLSLREGNISDIKDALSRIIKIQGGFTKVAKKIGTTRQALHQKLSSTGRPAFANILQVMRALGFELGALYVKP